MVVAMSGEPNQNGEPRDAPADAANGAENGELPVEVVPPEAGIAVVPDDGVEARIAALEKDKKDNWDRYLRAAADLENLRKRQKREMDDVRLESKGRVLKEMLPVVDNLERAIEHATAQAGTNPIVEGVQLVLRQFLTAFERLDVTPIEAGGQHSTNLHEAISRGERRRRARWCRCCSAATSRAIGCCARRWSWSPRPSPPRRRPSSTCPASSASISARPTRASR
jgi:molecular chaperone GrpE